MSDIVTLEATADIAFSRYMSTCRTGGTPAQRQFAFDRYRDADAKYGKAQHAEQQRQLKRKQAEAAHGAAA